MKRMSYQGSERPARWQSGLSVVMGIGILIAAIAGFASKDIAVFGTVFVGVWFVSLIAMIVYHGANAFGKNRPAFEEHEGSITHHQDTAPAASREQRLAELKKLHDANLITTEDYDARKQDILNEL